MPVEHIQKEKEYGIPWRSAFKKELYASADELYKLMIDQNGNFPTDEDPFIFFYQVIKKDAIEAAAFDNLSQADFMSMLLKNLELFERILFTVKSMLREQDFDLFEVAKGKTLERLHAQQVKMNPKDVKINHEQKQAIASKVAPV